MCANVAIALVLLVRAASVTGSVSSLGLEPVAGYPTVKVADSESVEPSEYVTAVVRMCTSRAIRSLGTVQASHTLPGL